MIRIDTKNGSKLYYFPRNFSEFAAHNLKLYSEVTGQVFDFIVEDVVGLADYFTFVLDFKDVPNGEWVYTLTDFEDRFIHTGLIRIGKLETTDAEYNSKRTETQYTPDI